MSETNSAASPLVATWRLRSHFQKTVETDQTAEPRGPHPGGLLTYTADGRFSIIAVPGDRRPPDQVLVTDDEAVRLFQGLTAYAGRYSIDGEHVTHHIEVSWNELWAKTDQRRRFVVDGDTLTIIAGPGRNPRDGLIAISTLVWDRIRESA